MKSALPFLLLCLTMKTYLSSPEEKLKALTEKLYEVEDKVDHLLFHFSHDVTKHEYKSTPYGTFLSPAPKNANSIHQKLKLIDYLNHQMGHPASWQTAANNAYNMGMGSPAAPQMGGQMPIM